MCMRAIANICVEKRLECIKKTFWSIHNLFLIRLIVENPAISKNCRIFVQLVPMFCLNCTCQCYKISGAISPLIIPATATAARTKSNIFAGKAFFSIKIEGRLTAGNVISKAAAGPTPSPKDINVCTTGISAAVGMTKSVPAIARPITARILLPQSGPTAGKGQVRAAPRTNTTIVSLYSGG